MASILDFSPFIPGDQALARFGIPDRATELNRAAARLDGKLAPESADTIRQHMAVINSYYSNLIEGNRTLPHEIREAQHGDFSDDPVKRDYQLESVAHIEVQRWIRDQSPSLDQVCSAHFILELHRRFYEGVPDSLREVGDGGSRMEYVEPGQWRKRDVKIGQHVPPAADSLDEMMTRFCEEYGSARYQGDKRLIALISAHHRFLWVHPFLDGNGRVVRLWTDAALQAAGLESYGVWCLSRGLARDSEQYRTLLARADFPRQGSSDGRGYLSEGELARFCQFVLDTALDQVNYISGLLELQRLKQRIEAYIRARNDHRVVGLSGGLKEIAATILYSAFLNGSLPRSEAIELTGMHERNARRLLKQLKDDGLLSETSTRSPLRWEIPDHAAPFYFPQLAPSNV
ncbi:Fic family protein [Marinobacter sp. OP 3.4]|uniref:Fic family protein n=1 Tax=Marinobacter sp. OP 3.4 TaxID=3076501 RepID=UPI002E202A54